jgi:apolipoprotein N-acyltransferase
VHGQLGLAWIGLGFAWLDLGNAAIDWPWLLRLVPVMGVHGVSFALAMVSVAIALVVLKRPPKQLLPLVALLGVFAFPALPPPTEGRERARVVQTNVDVEATWTENQWEQFQRELQQLSLGEPASLLVWPEAPVPFYPSRPAFAAYMANIARSVNADFVMGGIANTESGDPLNSVFFMSPDGQVKDRYDKIQLVPFGEYIPPAFGWVNRITGEAGDFVPGKRIVTYDASGHKIGAFICYESAFPGLVRQFTFEGAQLLLNLSNDGYFGGSKAREQHLSLVRMRAVENGRWVLRSTNDGITAMVDPAGRVTQRLPEHQRTSAVLRFNYESGVTPYVRWGDWFPWTCLIVAFGAAIYIGPLRSVINFN